MRRGHCLCGAVRFEVTGPDRWRAHCHCESCRRQTASPMTTFFGIADGDWRWTGVAPAVYASSEGVERSFCARCGSPVAFRSTRWPDEIHFYAALLEDHAGFRAGSHVHWSERVGWLAIADDLPKDG